jgi:hypothetical protein
MPQCKCKSGTQRFGAWQRCGFPTEVCTTALNAALESALETPVNWPEWLTRSCQARRTGERNASDQIIALPFNVNVFSSNIPAEHSYFVQTQFSICKIEHPTWRFVPGCLEVRECALPVLCPPSENRATKASKSSVMKHPATAFNTKVNQQPKWSRRRDFISPQLASVDRKVDDDLFNQADIHWRLSYATEIKRLRSAIVFS